MIRSTFGKSVLLGTCLAGVFSSGCISVSTPSFSKSSGKKQNIQRVTYEEEIPDAPGDPQNPEQLKLAYARWMEEINDVTEARKHYSAVSRVEPENVEAILGLARLDQLAGQFAEAEQKYKRAIKIAPDSPAVQYSLGQFYASQQRWDESREPLTAAMLADPENTTYRYHLAVALVHTDDITSALPHFIRTIGDAEGHYNVGLILHEEGRYDEAEKHFLLAVTKKPGLKKAEEWLVKMRQQRLNENSPTVKIKNAQSKPIMPVVHSSPQLSHSFSNETPGTTRLQSLTLQQQEQTQNQQLFGSR